MIDRRHMLMGAGALGLTGCDALNASPGFRGLLRLAEGGNEAIHRALVGDALAREYRRSERSPIFRANGTQRPDGVEYARHVATRFADWRLIVDGLVARPQALALDAIRREPARTQITRHDCVEGWSAIGEWTGMPLSLILDRAGVLPGARYVLFRCADTMGDGRPYYESISLAEARHPQTILAWALNGEYLPIPNGAPLRLRVERQLGYKHAKYVTGLTLIADLAPHYGGRGGYWEDVGDYEWYAGA